MAPRQAVPRPIELPEQLYSAVEISETMDCLNPCWFDGSFDYDDDLHFLEQIDNSLHLEL